VPLPPGVGDQGYLQVMNEIVIPLALRYAPQLILVSAGYDVHWREPLANMAMSLEGISGIVSRLLEVSRCVCDGRMVFLLEGGYDLDVLGNGVLNTFHILNDELDRVSDPIGKIDAPETPIDSILRRVKHIHNL
jgi:acetoin utilization deacetylase AcuC-like enzyme